MREPLIIDLFAGGGGAEDVQKAEWYLNRCNDIVSEFSAVWSKHSKMAELISDAKRELENEAIQS